ncbi:uncharacterized protein LOC122400520 [Colletes gigas]|uniref:uncharacterized protein LOC122400520 n=1 Tax=Colletes gigas TaxID=935657 RepID=UPI001C9B078C|nr:uncharacterized protein LOC122400520 [Colletes gigas]
MPNENVPANEGSVNQRSRTMKNKRRTFKAQITAFGKYLSTFGDSAKERVKLRERIERARKQFESFNDIQDELGLIDDFEETEAEREFVTDQYDDVMASAVALLEQLEQPTTQHSSATTVRIPSDSPAPPTSSTAIGVHLPKIDLPKFDGRLEKWVAFKDAFQTMIHAHPGLSDIQRLNYLRLSLSGKAESAIESFTISEENYKSAWDQLIETYDNTRALVLRHAALLRDTPAMRDDTSESICDLVNHMQSHVRSLQALGRSWEDIASDLITSIAISKMGVGTRRAWEQTLGDTKMPKITDIFRHLRNASHQSREDESSNHGTYEREIQAQPSKTRAEHRVMQRKPPPPAPRTSKRYTFATTVAAQCRICNTGAHPAYQCRKFIDATPGERVQLIRKAKFCLNCLRPDHTADDCKSGKCRVCDGRHNTKLHQDSAPRADEI